MAGYRYVFLDWGHVKKCFSVFPVPSVRCSPATLSAYKCLRYLITGFKWSGFFFFLFFSPVSRLHIWQGGQRWLQRFNWRATRPGIGSGRHRHIFFFFQPPPPVTFARRCSDLPQCRAESRRIAVDRLWKRTKGKKKKRKKKKLYGGKSELVVFYFSDGGKRKSPLCCLNTARILQAQPNFLTEAETRGPR